MSNDDAPMIHPSADVAPSTIGARTRVWQFCVILEGARIGEDCNICANVVVEGDVVVGNRVTVKCGVQLWDGVSLGDDVFVGPNATFTNDKYPRSRNKPDAFLQTIVEKGASIGANATILPGVTIGAGAMVGAGSVVVKDVPAGCSVVGNPARRISSTDPMLAIEKTKLVDLPRMTDGRGNLSFVEGGNHIPFDIKRVYYLYEVGHDQPRGMHAHRDLKQLIIAIHGSFDVKLDNGLGTKETVTLERPDQGLQLENVVWREIVNFSPGAVCLVLASERYDENDYIRDYDDFCAAARTRVS